MGKLYSLAITLFVAFVVVACGGGGGTSAETSVTAASVGITMADSSTPVTDELLAAVIDDCDGTSTEDCQDPPEECSEDDDNCDDGEHPQLLINVTSVVLIGPDGREEIFSGSRTIDLFDLKEGIELMFLDESATPGRYSKIRMYIDGEPFLISDRYPDGVDVKLPSSKIDLNPRETFTVAAGDKVLIKLDWHAKKSLKLVANNQLILRPLIFVDIEIESDEGPALRERIVRASGIVGAVGADRFELCMAVYIDPIPLPGTARADNEEESDNDCIEVIVTDKTGLFDDNGEPKSLSDLITGDPLTVVGLLRTATDDMDECDEASIPESECNIDTSLAATASSDGKNDDDSEPEHRFEIIAAVVECGLPGTWIRERGTLETAPDGMGEFDFRLAGADGRLLIGKIYTATRILLISQEEGITEITAAELQAGYKAIVEAVFVTGDDTGPTPKGTAEDCEEASLPEDCEEQPEILDGTLRIAIMLVIMGDDGSMPPPRPGLAAGELKSVNTTTGRLIVATRAGDRCVDTDEDTVIYQIVVTDNGIDATKVSLDELIIDNLILAAGTQDACIEATIIVSQGPNPEPAIPD